MQYRNQQIEYCLEGHHSVFKSLAQKEKEILVQHHTYASYRKGEVLVKEGEKPHGLICLASGKVKIFKEGVGGREQILKMIRPLGFLSYRALFSDNTYYASAVAIEDSSICILEKDCVVKMLKRNPDLALKFMKLISEELAFSNNRTVSLTQKHIRGRLAESLIVLRDTYGFETDGLTLNAYLSREDIANLSNMTTSNAIRTLSNLATEEIISIEGRKIMILDNPKLERISDLG
ncbi:MAG TPA: Crp/Fnr family transcriptional regulator [Bacteroidales bacterium]|nr:Crp/Fnr family transcriptional regulator [Bacteroidales bacterium]